MNYYSSPQDSQQFELFPPSDEQNSGKKGLFSKKISLALEHVIIIGIVLLVLGVVVFSLGVERGKHAAIQKMEGLEINLADQENDVILTPSSEDSVQKAPAGNKTSTQSAAAPVKSGKNQEIVVDVPVPVNVPQEKSAEPAVSGVYTVQVASFKQAKFADQEVDSLKKKGYEAFRVVKGDYYLVCVGKYKNKTQADKTSKSLKSKYKDNITRRL